MSFNDSAQSSSSQPYPAWLAKYFQRSVLPLAAGFAGQVNPSGGPLTAAAGSELSSTLAGNYLNPASNPAEALVVSGIQSTAQQNLSNAIGQLNGQSQGNGTLFSTKTAQVNSQAARESAADVANQVAGVENQNYGQERQLQAGAVAPALNMGQMSLQDMLQLLNLMKGSSSRSAGYSFGGAYNGPTGASGGGDD